MRKLQTKEERERKQKRNLKIMSVILLVIMFMGMAGYAFSYALIGGTQGNSPTQTSTSDIYQGSTVAVGSNQVPLAYPYTQVENISVASTTFLKSYSGNPLYIVSNNTGIASELASTIGAYASRYQLACIAGQPCNGDYVVKSCNSGDNIIVWQDSLENKVYQNQSCVFIQGDLEAVDAFIYTVFGGPAS